MREKSRIDPFCAVLSDGWKKVPYLRFGQVMYNFFQEEFNSDPFYIEDDVLLKKFSEYTDKISKKNTYTE